MAADVKRPRFLADVRRAVAAALAAKGGAPALLEAVEAAEGQPARCILSLSDHASLLLLI